VENASQPEAEIADNLVTWVFNDGFVPSAKITSEGNYSIISDYLGTPVEAYDEQGHKVWSAELDVYGRVNEFTGEKDFIPFRYQGQYEDLEIGLYYKRFRYYDPEQGNYTQVDPIGLAGGNPTLYGYVGDPNSWLDQYGLNTSLGNIGESEIVNRLNNCGRYSEVVQIQNNSGHGVDILSKNKYTGEWSAYEIKTTKTNRNPRLSRDQKLLGANKYTQDRLNRAGRGIGHYQSIPSSEKADARRILAEIRAQGGIKTGTQINVFVDSNRNIKKVKGKKWCT